ncbi:MAG: alpha/beta fold hydrolase [Clostridia bacterium]|nr:alpha/beta fold hydrolase [Clostridia bacterium]
MENLSDAIRIIPRKESSRMCLISYFSFKAVFGRKHPPLTSSPNRKKTAISSAADYMMGPHYQEYQDYLNGLGKIADEYAFEKLTVRSDDGLLLAGHLYRIPGNASNRTAVLVHGYGSNGLIAFHAVGREFIRRGYNIFLIDNRGCGESEGNWTAFGQREKDDLMVWIRELVRLFPDDRFVVHGNSLGGTAVCMASSNIFPEQVKALSEDCGFNSTVEQLTHICEMNHIPKFLVKTMEPWFRHYNHTGYSEHTALESVSAATLPMFFAHGKEDRYVPCENAEKLYDACPTEKELIILDGRAHGQACMSEQTYYDPLFAFLDRFCGPAEANRIAG